MLGYLIVAGFLVGFCMVANRLSTTSLTTPMIFLGVGLVVASTGLVPAAGTEDSQHIVAEVTLIVLLFLDAAQIDQKTLLR